MPVSASAALSLALSLPPRGAGGSGALTAQACGHSELAVSSGRSRNALLTSFVCAQGRIIPHPLTGLPCRTAEETSCNAVHATCAVTPKVGWKDDLDPLGKPSDSFVLPKGPCQEDFKAKLAAKAAEKLMKRLPLRMQKVKKAALAKKEVLKEKLARMKRVASVMKKMSSGMLPPFGPDNDECNARMIDLPFGLRNPDASEGEGPSLLSTAAGFEKQVNEESLSETLWGQAVHGMSGTWSFDSGGEHAADYVYEVEQGGGVPNDFYLCDSRTRPQQCALIGGNLKHACAEYYDPRQCDFCEDLGVKIQCTVRGWNHQDKKWSRVPIYPRDLLGELYRGEWKDVWARPMWASITLLKGKIKAGVKKLPKHMLTGGPGEVSLLRPGPVTMPVSRRKDMAADAVSALDSSGLLPAALAGEAAGIPALRKLPRRMLGAAFL